MVDNAHLLEISSMKQMLHRLHTGRGRIAEVVLSFVVLTVGGLIYVGYRDKSLLMFRWFEKLGISNEVDAFREFVNSGGIYGWVKYCLPDGLWLFAYMFLIGSIWGDSKSWRSYVFLYSLPIVALISEILQYFGLLPGTFDWMDIASYLFAILLYETIKILK